MKGFFLHLISLGLGVSNDIAVPIFIDWYKVEALAEQQGLLTIVLDGVEKLPEELRPPKDLLLQWIGISMKDEGKYFTMRKTAADMSLLFHKNFIRTYILKGDVVSECYPKPEHRVSSDIDCYLLPEEGDFDAWALGNDLIKSKGCDIATDFYKNSSFYLPSVTVENHKYLTPFRGNQKLKSFERTLQLLLRQDKGEDRFGDTFLYRPPVMVSALFLIEHAYSHFLHEGLTWRMVMDWMMFKKRHKDNIIWNDFDAIVEGFGFKRFYDSYYRLGKYLLGEIDESNLTIVDRKMLADVWAPLDIHETLHGVKGKLGLVGNTLRANWKYRYYGDISMFQALWIQIYGFLFDKNPALD